MKKPLHEILFGDPEKSGMDKYLTVIIHFLVVMAAFLATLVNMLLQIDPYVLIGSLLLLFLFIPLYYFSRFRNRYLFGKFFSSLLVVLILNYFWFYNNASLGPILYLLVAFFSVVVFIFEGRSRIFFSLFLFFDLLVMYLLERNFPAWFKDYPDRGTRLLDIYSGIGIYISLLFILMITARNFLEKQRQKAQRSDELKSAFLANMSHEIRTPMNAVVGFSQLLERNPSPEKLNVYVKVIRDNSLFLLQLIDDIIDISKIEANQLELAPAYFSVHEVLDELKLLMQSYMDRIGKKHLIYNEEREAGRQLVFADRTRVKQVLVNLLTNAAKYTEQGMVTIGYHLSEKQIGFYVKDTGVGIEPEKQSQIFDRFVKLDNAADGKFIQGTGLGLAISRKITEMMGGRLTVQSIPGAGSTFNLTIPLIKESHFMKTEKEVTTTQLDFGNQTILIAEDEDSNFELLKEILCDVRLTILRAKTGAEALDILEHNTAIKLVLMDIRMPVMDGLTATREIHRKRPGLPVIAQTAYAMESDHKRCLDAGCVGYLAKPINEALLFSLLKEFIH